MNTNGETRRRRTGKSRRGNERERCSGNEENAKGEVQEERATHVFTRPMSVLIRGTASERCIDVCVGD